MPEGLTYGSWIGIMPISRHPFWSMTYHAESLLEKAFGGIHIPFLAQHGINQIAIAINSTIQIAPCSMYFDIRLIHVPGGSGLSASLGTQLLCQKRSKTSLPVANCLMGEDPTTLQEHLGKIAQAQLVPQRSEEHTSEL